MGASIALELASEGYDVAIAARTLDAQTRPAPNASSLRNLSDSTLASVAADVEARGATALPVQMDLADLGSVAAAADAVLTHFGRCDVLVNNGVYQGPGASSLFLETAIDDFATHLRADVVAPGLLVRTLVPGMIERGRGVVVNMSSFVVANDPPGTVLEDGWSLSYAAGKAGLDRFASVLNVELRDTGVMVFTVEPGFVAYGPALAESLEKFPGRPVCPPEAIGVAVRWLVSAPEAARLIGKRIHLPAITERNGLLPGWDGPGSAYDRSSGA
jgi:NAD(P)-dependent dehydrogenase (short-subunit alcohol dehydrogenase family)